MKKNVLLALVAIVCALPLLETTAANPEANDPVLLTIDGKPVMASEFLYIYAKNSEKTAGQKGIDEYIDM